MSDLCRMSGVYRSAYGHRIPMEEGWYFPSWGGHWSRVNDLPSAEEIPGEIAKQKFWQAFGG